MKVITPFVCCMGLVMSLLSCNAQPATSFKNPIVAIEKPSFIGYPDSVEKGLKKVVLPRKAKLEQATKVPDSRYIIKHNFDLGGDTLVLAKNSLLYFRGGSIKNGVIVGNNTMILYRNKAIFENIKIEGTWNVPIVSSEMFADSPKDNVLKELFNLSDNNFFNRVEILEGTYYVSALQDNDAVLRPKSNTEIILDGNICLRANDFPYYQVMAIYGANNVYLHGKGSIVGDMYQHQYTMRFGEHRKTHEWGHGLTIRGCQNVLVEDITCKDCTGDACSITSQIPSDISPIAEVGTPSLNITVKRCRFEGARRQGMTIGYASHVTIDSCFFANISQAFKGTAPGAGIDIEPDNNGNKKIDKGCESSFIIIENCMFDNCNYGIQTWRSHTADDVRNFHDMIIKNCQLSNIKKWAIGLTGFRNVQIENCKIENAKYGVRYENSSKVQTENMSYNNVKSRTVGQPL